MAKFAVFILSLPFLLAPTGCGQPNEKTAAPGVTLIKSWYNSYFVDSQGTRYTGVLYVYGPLQTAWLTYSWQPNGKFSICRCQLAVTGTEASGNYAISSCTQDGTSGDSCTYLNTSGTFVNDGLKLILDASTLKTWHALSQD